MPSSSMGFSVAMTINGSGRDIRSPPIVAAPSAMASSIADWVFALERLISSSRTMLALIGPICVTIFCEAKSNICVPTISEGIRSGVHWMRLKDPETHDARIRAAVVLARPGTDSIRMCPPATSVMIRDSLRSSCPTRPCEKRLRMRSASSLL